MPLQSFSTSLHKRTGFFSGASPLASTRLWDQNRWFDEASATVAGNYGLWTTLYPDDIQSTLSDPFTQEPDQAEAILRIFVQQAIDVLPLEAVAKVADHLFPVQWGYGDSGSMTLLASGYVVPTSAASVYERLTDLPGHLRGSDWEHHGMAIPDESTIARAVSTLSMLTMMTKALSEPQVVATPAGGIQLEWHNERFDLEVNISNADEADAYLLDVKNNQHDEFEDLRSASKVKLLSDALKKML